MTSRRKFILKSALAGAGISILSESLKAELIKSSKNISLETGCLLTGRRVVADVNYLIDAIIAIAIKETL